MRASFVPYVFMSLYILAVTVGTFTGGLWGIVGIAGSLIVFIATSIINRKIPVIDKPLAIFIFASLGIVALLNLQSPYAPVAWHALLQQATIMIPLLLFFSPNVLSACDHPKFFPAVTVAAGIGGAALGLEFLLGAPLLHLVKGAAAGLTEYNRGVSTLVMIAFPLMGWLWMKGYYKELAVFVVILLVPFSLTESRATKAAFLFGVGVSAAAFVAPRLVKYGLVVLLFALLAFPFAVPEIFTHHHNWIERLPPSWYNRVEIWDYMSYRIYDRPWLGWGIGTSNLLPYALPHGASYLYVNTPAGHPHNVILHLWVETGIPGLVMGLIFALMMLHKASRFPKHIVPFAFGAWAATLAICLVAYNFWNASLFAAFALTALALQLLARQGEGRTKG